MWGIFAAAIALLVVFIGAARALGFKRVKPWTAHLETLQTVLTIGAASIAAVWYFFERPQAAKLDLTQQVQVVPLSDNRVLLLIEVSPKNLGGAAINFAKSPYLIDVGQVTPLTMTPYNEAREAVPPEASG